MRFLRRLPLAALALFLVAAAACSDTTGPRNIPIEETTFGTNLGIDLSKFTKLSYGLYVRDSVAGTGATVATGQNVSVQYTLYLSSGEKLESNTLPAFKLGSGAVIPGWDLGIPGMKVLGTRRLIVPPELAYGSSGYGRIPAYAVLVFDVKVLSAQ